MSYDENNLKHCLNLNYKNSYLCMYFYFSSQYFTSHSRSTYVCPVCRFRCHFHHLSSPSPLPSTPPPPLLHHPCRLLHNLARHICARRQFYAPQRTTSPPGGNRGLPAAAGALSRLPTIGTRQLDCRRNVNIAGVLHKTVMGHVG